MTQNQLASLQSNSPSLTVESDQQKSHQLPEEISSWASLLHTFLPDLRGPLTQMGDVLSKVIQVLPLQETAGQDEPDGIDGIHSLVNYERLLTSEWALYHDFPEEFIRRAAFKEHQFYKLAHHERTNDEAVHVLLDCGPEQLGRPRVVQLAVLILLLRYAETMQATLYWGVIQDTTMRWFEGITPNLIDNWLLMCSADLLDTSLLTQRLEQLDQTMLDHGRVWCVTPEPLADFPQLMLVNIRDNIAANAHEQRKVTVKVGRAQRQQIQTLLLPEDTLCNQILNDPFKKASTQSDESKSWLLSQTGAFIVLINQYNYLRSYKVLGRNPSMQLQISKPATILGVFVNKRNTFVLAATRDEYVLHGFSSHFKHQRYPKSHKIQTREALPAMTVLVKSRQVLLVDAQHKLRCLTFSDDTCIVTTIAKSVAAFSYNGNYVYYVALDPHARKLVMYWVVDNQPNFKRMHQLTLQTQVQRSKPDVFFDQVGWSRANAGRVAFRVSETEWNIRLPDVDSFISLLVHANQQVIGLYRVSDFKEGVQSPVLVCMDTRDQQTFTLIGKDHDAVITVLAEPCVSAELNPLKSYIHYRSCIILVEMSVFGYTHQ